MPLPLLDAPLQSAHPQQRFPAGDAIGIGLERLSPASLDKHLATYADGRVPMAFSFHPTRNSQLLNSKPRTAPITHDKLLEFVTEMVTLRAGWRGATLTTPSCTTPNSLWLRRLPAIIVAPSIIVAPPTAKVLIAPTRGRVAHIRRGGRDAAHTSRRHARRAHCMERRR